MKNVYSRPQQPVASQPTLEIRLPISPTDKYLRMVRYFVHSMRTLGGPIAASAKIVLSVSRDHDYVDLASIYPWLNDKLIDIRWLDEALFRELEYDATGVDRFWVESPADVVALMDADMLIAGDFDSIIYRCLAEDKLLGFIAHVSPFSGEKSSERHWQELFELAGLGVPDSCCEHTGWGLMRTEPQHRYCPPYYNYGLVMAPRRLIEKLAATALEEIRYSDQYRETWFKSQIALTLGIIRHQIPWGVVSINDNFPLHVSAEKIRQLNPDPEGLNSPQDIRIFHYLGKGEINKQHFSSEQLLLELAQRQDLSPSARACADRLSELRAGVSEGFKAVSP